MLYEICINMYMDYTRGMKAHICFFPKKASQKIRQAKCQVDIIKCIVNHA